MSLWSSLFSNNKATGANKPSHPAEPMKPKGIMEYEKMLANERWCAQLDEVKRAINEYIEERLYLRENTHITICQSCNKYDGSVYLIAYFGDSNINYFISDFWKKRYAHEYKHSAWEGNVIADVIFKKRPDWLQGYYENIDWRDLITRLFPRDYQDTDFLFGYGGKGGTTLASYYECSRDSVYRQGDYDGFYYVEQIIESEHLLPGYRSNESLSGFFSWRKQFVDAAFNQKNRYTSYPSYGKH